MKYINISSGHPVVCGGVQEGHSALVLADLLTESTTGVLHVSRTTADMETLRQFLAFFAPDINLLTFPAWDCMPYDRMSPSPEVVSRRIEVLAALGEPGREPGILLTTIDAVLQRVPPKTILEHGTMILAPGGRVEVEALYALLDRDGYMRAATVREPGEFAIRGGILDVFPPGANEPLRLDLYGNRLETLRTFDPLTQRTSGHAEHLVLLPASEMQLEPASVERFRAKYLAQFGAVGSGDPLYESVMAGRRQAGAEHWLPLLYDSLETLFDLLPGAVIALAHGVPEGLSERHQQIAEAYESRNELAGESENVYRALPPESLTMTKSEWEGALASRPVVQFSPYDDGELSAEGRPGRDFAAERIRTGPSKGGGIILDALLEHIQALQNVGRRVIVAAVSSGSRDRLGRLLIDHGAGPLFHATNWAHVHQQKPDAIAMTVLGIEHGFETSELAVLSEQDILGERIARPSRKNRRSEDFIREVSSLSTGDLVVHVDHGIGRFDGLETLTVQATPHDCVVITYDKGDRMYLPVENIEVISRYGNNSSEAALDRLGGSGWQMRMSKARKHIREIAGDLLRIAAQRALSAAPKLKAGQAQYAEFCARFPYSETDDQERTISEVLSDLSSGQPMDRLVCGDVGFGKTEVALRSAFVAVMAGKQVAIVAPTTLLVRQHLKTFRERFRGWPVQVGGLSRLTKSNEATTLRRKLSEGTLDIVVGTHALLNKSIQFSKLGLLIVDEEQRFGVTHKERLKDLGADIHVLTLTATPIPRTLQLALSGVREMSLIGTPPVDRLAVRTFIMPFDGMVIREALRRELARGGQAFYVCPRIAELSEAAQFVSANVVGARVAIAHGQMPTSELEEVMNEFYEGARDVLVSTNIIESGIDIPTANTLVINRADMFGLAELYQLRGRIGRGKSKAYAYLTVPRGRLPTPGTEKRLRVMQALDGLGAGFTLASHDLDIRGAGNLLGDQQSGHIREVGFELYQRMLEEAVASARAAEEGTIMETEEVWSPQINVGTAVLIPESYVNDLDVRLGLYRRVGHLASATEIEAFAAELIDRFGPIPDAVEHLLQVVAIKQSLYTAGVERLDAGPKGATLSFRNNAFSNPAGLVRFLTKVPGTARLRPDHSLVVITDWARAKDRLKGVRKIAEGLANVAREAEEQVRASSC